MSTSLITEWGLMAMSKRIIAPQKGAQERLPRNLALKSASMEGQPEVERPAVCSLTPFDGKTVRAMVLCSSERTTIKYSLRVACGWKA